MLFEGVTFSLAGLVVLSFGVMRSDWGELVFGRRAWTKVTTLAAVAFIGVALYRPLDLELGLGRVSAIVQREVTDAVDPLLERLTTTTTEGPAPTGPAPAP